jgi:hypothetical protein
MNDMSTMEELAKLVVREFGSAHAPAITLNMRADLIQRIQTALQKVRAGERDACAEECNRRYDLWSSYDQREGIPLSLKLAARERANEACYLADLLRARGD